MQSDKIALLLKRVPSHLKRVPLHLKRVPLHIKRVPLHFKRVPSHFKRVPSHFMRVPSHLKRVPLHFKRVPLHINRAPLDFKRVSLHFKRVLSHFQVPKSGSCSSPIPKKIRQRKRRHTRQSTPSLLRHPLPSLHTHKKSWHVNSDEAHKIQRPSKSFPYPVTKKSSSKTGRIPTETLDVAQWNQSNSLRKARPQQRLPQARIVRDLLI